MDLTVVFATIIGVVVCVMAAMLIYGSITCWKAGSRFVPFIFVACVAGIVASYVVTVIEVFA